MDGESLCCWIGNRNDFRYFRVELLELNSQERNLGRHSWFNANKMFLAYFHFHDTRLRNDFGYLVASAD